MRTERRRIVTTVRPAITMAAVIERRPAGAFSMTRTVCKALRNVMDFAATPAAHRFFPLACAPMVDGGLVTCIRALTRPQLLPRLIHSSEEQLQRCSLKACLGDIQASTNYTRCDVDFMLDASTILARVPHRE